MGSVYEAQNISLGKRVALKFVALGSDADDGALHRFHREARAVSAVESAHIVQVFDTGQTETGEPFLVMELLEGEDLATRLRRAGRLAVDEGVAIVIQALRGLRRAHAAGIVHRDLKPDNLFLVRGEDDGTHVKIVDFGLSKMRGGDRVPPMSITQEGATIGTPLYMSPEQVEAYPDVDHRTDLWSMGAILYQVLAGTPPFPEKTYARLVIAICQREPKDLASLVPELPEGVGLAVRRALERDRDRRFQSADEFLSALAEATHQKLQESRTGMRLPPGALDAQSGQTGSGRRESDVGSGRRDTDIPSAASSGAVRAPSSQNEAVSSSSPEPPGAELRTHTVGGATLWLSQTPTFAIWRGEVMAPDRLRAEARDGSLHELRLEPVGPLRLGRTHQVGDEKNELVYADVASRLAATLRHDGVRWWLRRRDECSVPVQVGARALQRSEEAPLVHGTFVTVGGMRATMVDRRYVTPAVPAGAVDPVTGLLGRVGVEQEVASFLQRQRPGALLLVRGITKAADGPAESKAGAEYPPIVRATVAIHRQWPSLVVGYIEGTALLLAPGDATEATAIGKRAGEIAREAGMSSVVCGFWPLVGDGLEAGREIELALHGIQTCAEQPGGGVVPLRDAPQNVRFATTAEVLTASRESKRATLLFAIEEQNALGGVGPHVITALEQELAAVVATHAGQGAVVATLATGVVGACVSRKGDPAVMGNAVQCEWHSRPPVMDGKVELPRTLSWEVLHGIDAVTRAAEISHECADPHGVLSALSGGLPYPIAGRVHAAIASSSAIERVKMLFDVLEGTWRFIATVLASAYFAKRVNPGETPKGFEQMIEFQKRVGTRDGLSLGTWRELARIAARGFEDRDDPIGGMARDVLNVKLSHNQTFDTLSNLMHVERNSFAHGHYNEARAAADLPEFEQMTRTFLRALRPLCAWTLVTVEKTEPDLYGEVQTVEFIDHTGPFNTGTRRRIGLNSPVRLANVVYLARWREGLVLPLEPLVKRLATEDRFDLYWMDHLPRAGPCTLSSAVGGAALKMACDVRRLPPLLRMLVQSTG
jgi:serine/threonine protein kinase